MIDPLPNIPTPGDVTGKIGELVDYANQGSALPPGNLTRRALIQDTDFTFSHDLVRYEAEIPTRFVEINNNIYFTLFPYPGYTHTGTYSGWLYGATEADFPHVNPSATLLRGYPDWVNDAVLESSDFTEALEGMRLEATFLVTDDLGNQLRLALDALIDATGYATIEVTATPVQINGSVYLSLYSIGVEVLAHTEMRERYDMTLQFAQTVGDLDDFMAMVNFDLSEFYGDGVVYRGIMTFAKYLPYITLKLLPFESYSNYSDEFFLPQVWDEDTLRSPILLEEGYGSGGGNGETLNLLFQNIEFEKVIKNEVAGVSE